MVRGQGCSVGVPLWVQGPKWSEVQPTRKGTIVGRPGRFRDIAGHSCRKRGPRRLSRVDGHVVLCVLCVVSCMLCAMLCDVCDSTTEHAMFYVVCCVVLSAMCYVA